MRTVAAEFEVPVRAGLGQDARRDDACTAESQEPVLRIGGSRAI